MLQLCYNIITRNLSKHWERTLRTKSEVLNSNIRTYVPLDKSGVENGILYISTIRNVVANVVSVVYAVLLRVTLSIAYKPYYVRLNDLYQIVNEYIILISSKLYLELTQYQHYCLVKTNIILNVNKT